MSELNTTTIINNHEQGFVEQDTALESMRASDFDCYSAYGEVIDNSIQAYADDIRINIEERKDRQNSRSKKIGRIFFADNGHGMNIDLLHKCLKLGHSSRYNDRSGIGRFGVGMTLGAIHECRRVEVYSKEKGGAWHYTYLDLDEIKMGQLKYLPRPIPKNPEYDICNYITDSGSLVIWSKYDKQEFRFEDIITEARFWIGRTFRKFIWGEAKGYGEVKIRLNGQMVNAFDPLYYNKNKTGFENEKSAELLTPQVIPWVIPSEAHSKKQKSDIVINVSLLPEEYRRERGKGGDNFAKERFINRNGGVSILRNDREVFYGIIPYAKKLGSSEKDIDVNRWIGCEISFDAELDHEFSVKHIKRGAVPVRELKKKIEDSLHPTFRTLRERVRNRWEELDRLNTESIGDQNEDIGVSDKHKETITIIKKAKEVIAKNNKIKVGEEKNKEIGRKINPDASESELKKVIEGLIENGITIDEREFIGDTFLDIEHGNKLKTILYNTNSTFYKAYNEILNELKSHNTTLAIKYKILIDLIFVAYMLAESNIDPNEKTDGASFINELKHYWTINLTKILKKWDN